MDKDEPKVRKRTNVNVSEHKPDNDTDGQDQCLVDSPLLGLLTYILKVDVAMTSLLGVCVHEKSLLGSLRPVMKFLEISCHGIPWFVFTIIGILAAQQASTVQFLINLLLAQIIDILVLLVLKSTVRRPRPSHNRADMFADVVSVDKFSFPSGHSTRAVVVACVFIYQLNMYSLLNSVVAVWALAVCISRVLLGRHHVLDVVCGILAGILEYKLTEFIWLSEDTCMGLKPFSLYT